MSLQPLRGIRDVYSLCRHMYIHTATACANCIVRNPVFSMKIRLQANAYVRSRGLRPLVLINSRNITSTGIFSSGHNRWSKIKHDKKIVDARKGKARSDIAEELRMASMLYGPDPNSNPRLSTLVAFAKKSGFPKARIENAIARGQSKATDGRNLESLLVEAMIPPSIAVMIECQTDSRARTLETIKQALKHLGGSMTKTSHLFKRKGKILFGQPGGEVDHELFEKIIDSNTVGADFVDEDRLEVYTEPNQTNAAAEAISNASSRMVESKEIIWEPTPEAIIDIKSSNPLVGLIERLEKDISSYKIYTTARMED